MSARKLPALGRPLGVLLAVLIPLYSGCGVLDKHRENKIPHLGAVDPTQPRELQMVSMPPHVVEPPDELEVSVRPVALEFPLTTVIVQADGIIDLGFFGEVYVAGLTLDEVEQKLFQYFSVIATNKKIKGPVDVSVRLLNGRDSKRFYVMGTVTNENSYPLTGNETVLDGILLAGLRSNSLPEKAYLARPKPAGDGFQLLRIDWERIRMGDTLTNYQLMPGDRIVVPGGEAPGLLETLFGAG